MKVQAFWHGPLGTMERMCIQSYLKQGIEFHLYTYNPLNTCEEIIAVDGPRNGLTITNATEIAPESAISLFPWPSIFSDYFRYALLAAKGGWWVDMDTICLKPCEDWPNADYYFARDNIDQYYISGFVMKGPPAAPIFADAARWIDSLDADARAKLGHMDIGPYLLQRQVPERGLNHFVAAPATFDPIPWNHITRIVDPNATALLESACDQSAVIHLRQSIWNNGPNSCAGILPDGTKLSTSTTYDPNCLWEKLKVRFL